MHEGIVTMFMGIRLALFAMCAVLNLVVPAHAENQTFGELLTRAEAQAAAGHRWSPPDDNMTDTVIRMLDLLSTATPAEIAELSALLQSDNASRPNPGAASAGAAKTAPASSVEPVAASPQVADEPQIANATVPPAEPPTGTTSASDTAGAQATAVASAEPAPASLAPTLPAPIVPAPNMPAPNMAAPNVPPPNVNVPDQSAPAATRTITPERAGRAAALYGRGVDAEKRGDLSGARRFYASAAELGDAAAARGLGRLYDPAYVSHTAIGGIDPDPTLARFWYNRAVSLGDAGAAPLLQALAAR
jgi:TPR repeat protein